MRAYSDPYMDTRKRQQVTSDQVVQTFSKMAAMRYIFCCKMTGRCQPPMMGDETSLPRAYKCMYSSKRECNTDRYPTVNLSSSLVLSSLCDSLFKDHSFSCQQNGMILFRVDRIEKYEVNFVQIKGAYSRA